ncbi:MAG: selenocysteine-specific translation elongation factor [Acidobacteriota bacterium]|nr:selenocysteine-specific translation elongation factor [Acidobacteriota bacterium]
MKHIVVGTAGHIDHGKSTLIKVLTGVDPDRLKEERERGITIDLGFASLQLGDRLRVGFVDVPGHERFVKNMLAGVGGIDAVLLVVAANESIMPQTREHFDICRLLSIPRGLVVITKCDLVEREIVDLVQLELQDYLRGSFLEGAPVIPFNASSQEGLDSIRQALTEMGDGLPPRNRDLPFRLPIDRCFSSRGFGTVVTGTLVSGTIRKEGEVELYPTGKRSRVRHLQVYSREVDQAEAGQRTALNLQGVEVGEVHRGVQLSVCGRYRAVSRCDCRLSLLESSPVTLRNRSRVRFHLGTTEVLAEVRPLKPKTLAPGQTGLAHLELEKPVLALVGDSFILRRTSPMITVGGGVVLDIFPPPRRRTRDLDRRLQFLQAMDSDDPTTMIGRLTAREAARGIDEDRILSQLPVSRTTVRKLLSRLVQEGQVFRLGQHPLQVMDRKCFDGLCRQSLALIRDYQQRQALSAGLPREQLHSSLFAGVSQSVFKSVLAHLCDRDLVELDRDRVRLRGSGVRLSADEARALDTIEQAFRSTGLQVPSIEEVIRDVALPQEQARRLVALLTRQKKLVKVSETLFFHADSIEDVKKKLREHKKREDRIDVPTFKKLADVTRKYAIPLLEHLDRERVTRRAGDLRVIV